MTRGRGEGSIEAVLATALRETSMMGCDPGAEENDKIEQST